MRIKLNRFYSGQKIIGLPPGEYEASDERLNGLAAYLVSIEVADWVDTAPLVTKQVTLEEVTALTEDKPVKRSKAKVSDGN